MFLLNKETIRVIIPDIIKKGESNVITIKGILIKLSIN